MRKTITDQHGREHALPGPFPSIDHMKRANAARGDCWFSRETMHFFSSRVAPGVHAGRLFVTSERSGFDRSSPRLMSDDGDVSTVGEFLAFETLAQARAEIKRLLAGE